MSIEGAGVLASYDHATSHLSVWTSTQAPHLIRDGLSECLGILESNITVTAPDVGGAFGPKVQLHPEEIIVAYVATTFKCPVKWICT